MKTGDTLVIIAILIYFIVVLTIGFIYAKRSNSSASEYFLGGRKVGPWFTALSAEASDMSGYLLMGLPGLAYFTGAADAGWTAVGLAIGTYLNWLLVAKRLRRYSVVANDSITLPGFYSNRFHDEKNTVGTIAAAIILVFFCVYTGSCFVTVGKLFNTLFGWDYSLMMAFGAIIVFLYTMVGGYLSVVATDFVQGCLMFFALAVVVIGSIAMAGGIGNTVAFLTDIPGYLSMTQMATPALDAAKAQLVEDGRPLFGDASEYGILTIVSTLSWGLGYFGMPQVLVRFMGIRGEREVKTSRRIAIVWVVISMFSAVMIGIIGRSVLPTQLLSHSAAESIFIVLAQIMLPSFMCGIVVSGILAASMSSASSYLLITGSSVAENIYRSIFKKDATDEQVLIVSRITLAAVLLLGIFIAWDENFVIFTVVSYAWAGLGASFGPLTLFALFWKRTTKQGAIAGMLTGALTVLIWHNFIKPLGGIFGIYELLPAFLLGCLAIFVVSKLSPGPSQEILDDFAAYESHDIVAERNMEVVLEDGMTLND
ncbi:sodium/proline symporter [Curtanaerobium respiraculi]|uniref:sodium/proline symporter n=1 Tax=Curtanaerobium respiraculi TaxID=2949669 RepID=UPI0024B3AE0C|nr:sodium/proline symporter [Curtanaerobium respiraculi]